MIDLLLGSPVQLWLALFVGFWALEYRTSQREIKQRSRIIREQLRQKGRN